jgi:ATP-dependent RNA helicase RhlE
MTTPSTPSPQEASFRGMGLAPKLLEILDSLNLTVPTPIQRRAIPQAILGQDLIGVAQTGTGKTLAFGIPLLQRIAASQGEALILVPTRELAIQVAETLGKLGQTLKLSGVVLIGGAPMGKQIAQLRRKPHVIVATPGRLLDHMQERNVRLDGTSILVIDEADRMLDMGFWPQIRQIIEAVPKERQTLLFSATLSKEIMELATKHMKTPTSIEVAPPGTTVERVTQEFFIVRKDEKMRLLESVLKQYLGSTIVFTRTKHGAKRITQALRAIGHAAAEIHANRSLVQRKEAMEGFRNGRYRVLVATDIAARGIDVKGVELVVNYDIPAQGEDYVHRIGRTARAGTEGRAISFAMPEEQRSIRNIERLIRRPLRISPTPKLPPSTNMPNIIDTDDSRRAYRPQGRSGGFHGARRGSSRSGSSTGSFGNRRPQTRGPRR